jgi:hypothetical protein
MRVNCRWPVSGFKAGQKFCFHAAFLVSMDIR